MCPRRSLITVLVIASIEASLSALASSESVHQPRIIAGNPTNSGGYPWVVGLMAEYKGLPYLRCGGTLIAPTKVLTAAHCVSDESTPFAPEKLRVSLNIAPLTQAVSVAKLSIHPMYRPDTFYNDVAVVTLSEPVNQIDYVSMEKRVPSRKSEALIVGWGSTDSYGGTKPADLLEGNVLVAGANECRRLLKKWPRSRDAKLSAKICVKSNPANICDGDSGGPLFHFIHGKPIQLGIASHLFAHDCSESEWSAFTSISEKSIQSFIKKELQ